MAECGIVTSHGEVRYRSTDFALRVDDGCGRAAKLSILELASCPHRITPSYCAELARSVVSCPLVTMTRAVPAAEGMDIVDKCAMMTHVLMRVEFDLARPDALGGGVELRAGDPGKDAALPAAGPFFMVDGIKGSGIRLRARDPSAEPDWDAVTVKLTCGFISSEVLYDLEFAPCLADGVRWSGDVAGAQGPVSDPNMVLRVVNDV